MEMEYWAKKKTEDMAEDLYARIDNFYSDLEASGYFSTLRQSYRAYYGSNTESLDNGTDFNDKNVARTGTQGEKPVSYTHLTLPTTPYV